MKFKSLPVHLATRKTSLLYESCYRRFMEYRETFEQIQKKTRQSRRFAKIHVTRQFFEASSLRVIFSKKQKTFLDTFHGSMCTEFQVCIVFRFVTDRQTSPQTNIRLKMGISLAAAHLTWIIAS